LLGEQELTLVQSAQAGDAEAFDRLVELHAPRLYNVALRMLRSPEEAEEAAQEAFVRAYSSLKRFRGSASFGTWLCRITMNICLDQLKRRRRQPLSLDALKPGNPGGEIAWPKGAGDPAATAEAKERRAIIRAAIDSLPEAQRAVIVLCDLQGLSYEECARALKTRVGTVKSRLNRARLALKTRLEPQLELLRSA
jgi:RNA polymerase sigma-70 factor (ECF subfamily)